MGECNSNPMPSRRSCPPGGQAPGTAAPLRLRHGMVRRLGGIRMAGQGQSAASIFNINLRTAAVVLVFVFLLFATTIIAVPAAQAQNFIVLHPFSGNADGSYPQTGLTMDRAGNLYGTAVGGGTPSCHSGDYGPGCGTVFKLVRSGSGWSLSPLYSFSGSPDGAAPHSRLVFGPDGRLYGTTINGGQGACDSLFGVGCGTVFSLRPPANACRKTAICPWSETVLYRFSGGSDGGEPLGDLAFDQGAIYTDHSRRRQRRLRVAAAGLFTSSRPPAVGGPRASCTPSPVAMTAAIRGAESPSITPAIFTAPQQPAAT